MYIEGNKFSATESCEKFSDIQFQNVIDYYP